MLIFFKKTESVAKSTCLRNYSYPLRLKKSGTRITKGQVIAIIANSTSTEEYKLKSPLSGIIIGERMLPLVHAGQALFHIASFAKLNVVEEQLENLQEAFNLTDDEEHL